jgi:hypothetical protein
VNEVRTQLEELLFSSLENVLVESVEVTDMVVRVEALSTARQADLPGLRVSLRANTRLLSAVSP